jgi:hypothetical protein
VQKRRGVQAVRDQLYISERQAGRYIGANDGGFGVFAFQRTTAHCVHALKNSLRSGGGSVSGASPY